jgi:hypothetical protein
MVESRFPPSEVAAKLAVSLGIGLLVGIEREWSNKDLGARTFALTALLGTVAALFAPSMAIVSIVGVFLIVIFANARSLLLDRSLEATTSAALLVCPSIELGVVTDLFIGDFKAHRFDIEPLCRLQILEVEFNTDKLRPNLFHESLLRFEHGAAVLPF